MEKESYAYRILNGLLENYEHSVLYRGENKISVNINYTFDQKHLPEYQDISSMVYDEIHDVVRELERQKLIKINWKNGIRNHIVKSVTLNQEKIPEIYQLCERTPKSQYHIEHIRLLTKFHETYTTPVIQSFTGWALKRLRTGQNVAEYIDIKETKKTEKLLKLLAAIEENQHELYIREFSVLHFADTKLAEKYLNKIQKIMQKFQKECKEKELYEILAEYQIYHTPNYVHIKGNGKICLGKTEQQAINLQMLEQGIGLSGEDMENFRIEDGKNIKTVITIENQTSFFRWKKKDSLILYLGGYHNTVRRCLLKKIYEQLPNAEYLHFGDIDVGGFQIYEDLCEKTGIPFKLWHMGIEELQKYQNCTRKLTENDRERLEKLLKKQKKEYDEVLKYMKVHNQKLEQECILPESETGENAK